MAVKEQIGIRSVKMTGRHVERITATEVIGGEICRITLEPDEDGRYREVAWTPIQRSPKVPEPKA